MGSVSEESQDLVFHHCHFPTGTRRASGRLHHGSQYESISVFEHEAVPPNPLSNTEASEGLLQAAWALLLCNYTRNEIVVFVAKFQTSNANAHTNGVCAVKAADAWAVEYQALNKSDPREIHRVSLERCSSRALRDAQINTAIDFSGALFMINRGEKGRTTQLLGDQHVDLADIVSFIPIELQVNFARMQCICSTTPRVSTLVSYSVELIMKPELLDRNIGLQYPQAHGHLVVLAGPKCKVSMFPAATLLFIRLIPTEDTSTYAHEYFEPISDLAYNSSTLYSMWAPTLPGPP